MNVTQERFDSGLTYDEYKAQMTRSRDLLETNERAVRIGAADLVALKSLPKPLKVLVIAEDWCGDVIANLPVVGRLALDTGALDLRVFLRDQNLDLMDQCLKEGKYRSIPVFVFLDDNLQELGRVIERPASVTEQLAAARRQLFAAHPEFGSPDVSPDELPAAVRDQVTAGMRQVRAEMRDWANGEVIREVIEAVKGQLARPASAAWLRRPETARPANPVKVRITYCDSCGYEPQTLALVKVLMEQLRFKFAAIEIAPGEEGAFDVAANGEVVHSMYRDGGFGDAAEIVAAIRKLS
jgi:selT/selW/selH-like putative selenoprotein